MLFRLAILVTALASICRAAELVFCPDCDSPVSPRALMCPKCGCPGDVIAAEARKIIPDEPPHRDALIRVETEKGVSWALPVIMSGKQYAVMNLAPLAEAQTVSLSHASTNITLTYRAPELAVSAPLVRFAIDSTNLTYWATAQQSGGDAVPAIFLLTPSPDSTQPSLSPASDAAPALPALALLDSSTNLLRVVASFGVTPTPFPLHPEARAWAPVSPTALRRQVSLLSEALALDPTARAALNDRLVSEPWATPYLKQVASNLATAPTPIHK